MIVRGYQRCGNYLPLAPETYANPYIIQTQTQVGYPSSASLLNNWLTQRDDNHTQICYDESINSSVVAFKNIATANYSQAKLVLHGFEHKECAFHYETYDIKKPKFYDYCWSYRKRRDHRLEEFQKLFETDRQHVKMLFTYIVNVVGGGLDTKLIEHAEPVDPKTLMHTMLPPGYSYEPKLHPNNTWPVAVQDIDFTKVEKLMNHEAYAERPFEWIDSLMDHYSDLWSRSTCHLKDTELYEVSRKGWNITYGTHETQRAPEQRLSKKARYFKFLQDLGSGVYENVTADRPHSGFLNETLLTGAIPAQISHEALYELLKDMGLYYKYHGGSLRVYNGYEWVPESHYTSGSHLLSYRMPPKPTKYGVPPDAGEVARYAQYENSGIEDTLFTFEGFFGNGSDRTSFGLSEDASKPMIGINTLFTVKSEADEEDLADAEDVTIIGSEYHKMKVPKIVITTTAWDSTNGGKH
jgi:hypothetical protein